MRLNYSLQCYLLNQLILKVMLLVRLVTTVFYRHRPKRDLLYSKTIILMIICLMGSAFACDLHACYHISEDHANRDNYDLRIRSIILHYTVTNEEDSRQILKQGGVSAHYLIPRNKKKDGTDVWQLVHINNRAWHAGLSYWQNRNNLNDTSIGIEIVNYGYGLVQKNGVVLWSFQVEHKLKRLLIESLKKNDPHIYQLLTFQSLLNAFTADIFRNLVPSSNRQAYEKYVPKKIIQKYKSMIIALRKVHDPFINLKATDLYRLEKEGKLVWDEFTAHQRTTLIYLLKQLLRKLQIKENNIIYYTIDATAIVGHSDIAPDRKSDPGPRFPWKYLAAHGIGAWPDQNELAVIKKEIKAKLQKQPTINITWLQENLQHYGYNIQITKKLDKQTQDAIMAFQMHFESDYYTGIPTVQTISLLSALIKKYFPKSYVAYSSA